MSVLTCTIDLSELEAKFQQLGQLPSFARPLAACSKLISASAKDNFHGAHDPEGRPWKPLKNPRRKKGKAKRKGKTKTAAHHPLIDTGRLFSSVGGGADHVEQIHALELVTGTNVEYAGYHQDGTRTIPARPFLGFNDSLLDKIEDVIGEWAERQLGF